ncbi:Crp/Fnr family transcriptional regulator [Bradyrhizobium sp. WD16]|uniref:Crp/Fnr family transcriptional regulator n=1 Tax=Bradyrhizobium sp. WD16 TaxID=1521768 RepID=UPI0020A2687F|nr:Crp/Fnr family transcriptional regulator [Bradyrhizobium sp. WD16]UTD28342.1 Crp/Fnr family transcriptional regulator [Bradyrhizobium sp. WD16]
MISAERLRQIAFWAHGLNETEIEQTRRGIVEKDVAKGAYLCHRGDRLDFWTGMIGGVMKMATVSKSGKSATLAGLRAGSWFGEGSVLKSEPRRYDLIALRDSRVALMERATFFWLYDNSVAFNRFLIRQFNERISQFIGLVEYDRTLDAPSRVARSIAWLFNPVLYPTADTHLEITQEELGQLAGLSRQHTNEALKLLETRGLLGVERGGITVRSLAGLANYGE